MSDLHLLGLCCKCEVVAQIGLLGRLALISTLGLGGVAADLVIKTALRLRICGRILGDGDRTYIREIILS